MLNELKCPVCRNDSFLSPNIKIYISPCFHKICEQCLIKIFGVEYAPCPECGIQLIRINFISSTFESIEVEREIKIRRLLNTHYKTNTLSKDYDKYNDWLEEYENCVFSLMKLKNEKLIKNEIQKDMKLLNEKLNNNGTEIPYVNQFGEELFLYKVYPSSREYLYSGFIKEKFKDFYFAVICKEKGKEKRKSIEKEFA